MKRVLLLFCLYVLPANANIVPSFTTGTMSSTTNTTTTISETITSKDYKTGYEYTVTGTGIGHDGGNMSPDATQVTGTVGGQSYTWTGADMTTKPNWTLTNQGAFQFVETYTPSGVQSITDVTRTIESQSVTDTTTIFSQ